MGQDHADDSTVIEVKVGTTGEEKSGYVLVVGMPAANPYAVQILALSLQLGAESAGRVAIAQPRGLPTITSTLVRERATGRTKLRV